MARNGRANSNEFRKAYEEQRLGLPFREALVNLTQRIPTQDVRFFITALIIQDETGGNLAEILTNLSTTIRERFRLRREVRVRTAQGRLTALILISIPPILLITLNIINPEYSHVLFTDKIGIMMKSWSNPAAGNRRVHLWKIVNIDV